MWCSGLAWTTRIDEPEVADCFERDQTPVQESTDLKVTCPLRARFGGQPRVLAVTRGYLRMPADLRTDRSERSRPRPPNQPVVVRCQVSADHCWRLLRAGGQRMGAAPKRAYNRCLLRVVAGPAARAEDGLKPENPRGLGTLPCSLRKPTPPPEPVKSAAHFLRKLPPVALDSLLQRGHQQPRARQEPNERR